MNEREFSVVKIIAITGEKNVTIAERVAGVVLVGMTFSARHPGRSRPACRSDEAFWLRDRGSFRRRKSAPSLDAANNPCPGGSQTWTAAQSSLFRQRLPNSSKTLIPKKSIRIGRPQHENCLLRQQANREILNTASTPYNSTDKRASIQGWCRKKSARWIW